MRNEVIDYFLHLHGEDHAFLNELCGKMTHHQIWQELPESVPIGSLLSHVAEMERFWIDWGLCGTPYDRDRQAEFDRRGDRGPAELAAVLSERRAATVAQLEHLTDAQWTVARQFHGHTFTGAGILTWHLRHLSLHRGHVQAHERWLKHDHAAR